MLLSLLQTWLLLDPLFIILRNNLSCTRGRQRGHGYQTAEKAAQGPLALVGNVLSNMAA